MNPTLLARQRVISASERCAEVLAVDDDLALGGPVEAGDQVQERGLARARRPHQGEVLPFRDLEVEIRQDRDHELIAAVLFVDITQDDRRRLAHERIAFRFHEGIWSRLQGHSAIRTSSLSLNDFGRIQDHRLAG